MSQKKKLTPSALRFILAFLLIVVAGLMAAGFSYSYGKLSQYAVEVSHKKTDSAASDDSLPALQNIQRNLEKNKAAIARAQSITSTSELPQFEAVNYVKEYAARNNLAVKSVDLAGSTDSSTPAATTPTTPAAGSPTTPVVAKGSTTDVTVNFDDEVNYKDFLQFLADIENSIPKMQIQSVSLATGSSVDTVKVQPLTIHMYIN